VRVHRVYFRSGLYTDQVAANGAAARLYAARQFPKLGAPVKTKCMTLVVNGRRTHVDPKLDRSFVPLPVRRSRTWPSTVTRLQMASGDRQEGTAGH
jgi:hypothetical protein